MRSMMTYLTVAVLLCTVAAAANQLNLRRDTVTVSGISAGAFMAVQYQFAFSSSLRGAGIIAGGPYMCAQGSLMNALDCMNSPSLLNLGTFIGLAQEAADAGKIDPLENLQNHTVHLFSGLLDSVVAPGTMHLLHQMENQLNVTRMNATFDVLAEHSWVTSNYGSACSTLGSPYINNCQFDFGGRFLRDAFNDMGLPWVNQKGTVNTSALMQFSQSEFGAFSLFNSLANHGYLYIPEYCIGNKAHQCHLHINFHGCEQDADTLQTTYVLHTELNGWAESNHIVIFYPQATANQLMENPNACFDWWGYAGANYAHKDGAQIKIVRAIEEYLLSGKIPANGNGPTVPPPPPPGPPGPTQPPTPPPPPGPATCSGRPDGDTCLSTTELIVCPAGLVLSCLGGLTCQGPPGEGICL